MHAGCKTVAFAKYTNKKRNRTVVNLCRETISADRYGCAAGDFYLVKYSHHQYR